MTAATNDLSNLCHQKLNNATVPHLFPAKIRAEISSQFHFNGILSFIRNILKLFSNSSLRRSIGNEAAPCHECWLLRGGLDGVKDGGKGKFRRMYLPRLSWSKREEQSPRQNNLYVLGKCARATTLCRDFAYSTLMEVSLLGNGFLNERITTRSLNQFRQRDRTLRVSDIRIDRLPSMSCIRPKHRENFHVASSRCKFSVTSNNF